MGEDDTTDTRCPWSVQPAAVSCLCPRALPTGWPPGDFRATQSPHPPPGMASTFNNSWGSLGLFSPMSWQVKGQAVGRGLRSLSAASGGPDPEQPDPAARLWVPARQPAVPLSFGKPSPSVPRFCFHGLLLGEHRPSVSISLQGDLC